MAKCTLNTPGFVAAKPKFFVVTSVLKSPMIAAAKLSHPDKPDAQRDLAFSRRQRC